jgi:hypothetical protein
MCPVRSVTYVSRPDKPRARLLLGLELLGQVAEGVEANVLNSPLTADPLYTDEHAAASSSVRCLRSCASRFRSASPSRPSLDRGGAVGVAGA